MQAPRNASPDEKLKDGRALARWQVYAHQQRRRRVVWIALVILSLITAKASEVKLSALFDRQGWTDAKSVLVGLTSPDLSGDYLWHIFGLAIDSVLIGVLGTAIATVLGILLAFGSAEIPGLLDPPGRRRVPAYIAIGIRWYFRVVMSFMRSVPDIIWAYLFVRIMGLGPGPAVLALGISLGGIIGKLFSELLESVDPRPLTALWETGASRFAVMIYGALPQVRRRWLGYALFRLECAIRSASILGVVGAGGLGAEIALSIRYFEFGKLGTCLLAVLLFVIAVELASAYLRGRPSKWTVLIAAIGCGVAIVRLDIPWVELLTSDEWGRYAATFSLDQISTGFWTNAIKAMIVTLAMAWCATMAAAAIAFLLAPLATRDLTIGSYLKDQRYSFGFGWIALLLSRVFFMVMRAMPELTLALIAVLWVGPGPFAGVLAVSLHTVGILGRLYGEVYADVERGPVEVLQAAGASRFATWLVGIRPQVQANLISHTLLRFEINIRAAATMGFVGAGGIGDSLHTAVSLFHMGNLTALLIVMVSTVSLVDFVTSRMRLRVLRAANASPPSQRRRQDRVRIIAEGAVSFWHGNNPAIRADMLEVSMGGMLLGGKGVRFVQEQTAIHLRLATPDGTSTVDCQAEVAINRMFEDGTHGLGIAFVNVSPDFRGALLHAVKAGKMTDASIQMTLEEFEKLTR